MKKAAVVVVLAVGTFLTIGCMRQDPRVPLDEARKNINDVRAFQLQALALRGLQDDLQDAFARDSHVVKADVVLYFGTSDGGLSGQRLIVDGVTLLTLAPGSFEPPKPPPSAQPAQMSPADAEAYRDKYVQDLVRDQLARHGWEVEDVTTYHYEKEWRITCRLRAASAPPWAGAGLDILPKRNKSENK
jgi:hypothetical protein